MLSRPLFAILAAFALSGCVIYGSGGGTKSNGNVTISWSFAGKTCAEVPGVKSVVVTIPGETLQDRGVFPCLVNDYPGIVLHDFRPKSYSYTLEAVGFGNEKLFIGTGTFVVNGDVRTSVDLTPVGGPNSYAYLTWRFPANSASATPNCDGAGIANVDVSIDGATATRFACAAGFVQPGIQTPYLAAGNHSIVLTATNSSGYPLYRFEGQLQTFAGAPVAADYLLPWAVGGAAVGWQFTNGSTVLTCASAGITTVWVNFQDAAGNMVYGTDGDPQPCASSPVVYSFLQEGNYKLFLKAGGAGNSLYLSSSTTPPIVTVSKGVFVTGAQAIGVQLFRVQ